MFRLRMFANAASKAASLLAFLVGQVLAPHGVSHRTRSQTGCTASLASKPTQPATHISARQTASCVPGDDAESAVQSVESDVPAIGELIEYPEYTMNLDAFGNCEFAEAAIARQKNPFARFSESKCEGVRHRQRCITTTNDCRPRKLCRLQDLNAETQLRQFVAKIALEFSIVKKVRHCEFERQSKQVFDEPRALQIDQNRSVGNEDSHEPQSLSIQSNIQLANRYP